MGVDGAKLLEAFGVKEGAFGKIKLAHGVVGKTCALAAIAFVVVGVGIRQIHTESAVILLVMLVLGVFVWFTRSIFIFAQSNPAAALLEGAELVAYRHQELAAKGIGTLPLNEPDLPDLTPMSITPPDTEQPET